MSSLSTLFSGSLMPSASTLLLLGKATFLLVAALVGTAALRKSSAGMRHMVWVITLASLVILPAVASRLPLRLAVLPASFGDDAGITKRKSAVPSPAANDLAASVSGAEVRLTATDPPQTSLPESTSTSGAGLSLRISPLALLATLWGLGAALCLFWLAHGTWSVARIVRRATPMNVGVWEHTLWEVADRIGLDSVPRLVASRDVAMPFASGLMRPVIVLPADAESWSDDRRTSVLLHELAHIKRRDLVGHTLGRVACALYWFHPLVWTAAKRLRVESERACDDIALGCGAKPSDYAEQLLDIVTAVRRQFTPAVALAMAHRKEFEGRMLAILDPEVRRAAPTRRQTFASITTVALLSLVVGAAVPATPNEALAVTPANNAAAPVAPVASSQADKEPSVELRTQTNTTKTQVTETYRRTDTTIHSSKTGDEGRVDKALDALSREASAEGNAAETARELLSAQQGKGDERARLLMNILKTDTSANLRRIAAWGLSDHANESGVAAALAEALRKDANASVREMAAWALGESDGEKDGVAALVAAIKADADDKVKSTALWALGQSGSNDAAAIEVMTEALRSKESKVRETALWAIGNMEPEKAPREVLTALGDSSVRVRELATWVLFQVADESAVSALEGALDREKEPSVRRGIVRALAATGEKSTDALSKLLGSNDPEIRSLAVKALAGSNGAGPWPWPWPKPRPFP